MGRLSGPPAIEFVCHLLFYACLRVLHKILLVLRGTLLFMLAYTYWGCKFEGVCLDPPTIEFVCHLLFYTGLHVLYKIQLFSGGILSFVLAYVLRV